VEDPKDYRFCGYAEAVARATGSGQARAAGSGQAGCGAEQGICYIWAAYADGSPREALSMQAALQAHRELIFGKLAAAPGLTEMSRKQALKVLEQEDALLPKSAVLRCRVRYFTDGAILGSQEFVRGFVGAWQMEKGRKYPPKPNLLRGADWQGLATIQGLRKKVFG